MISKLSSIALTILSMTALSSISIASVDMYSNKEWFDKVPKYIPYNTYIGTRGLFKGCEVTINPSDKNGIIAVIRTTDLLNPKTLAAFDVRPDDTLVGYSKSPAAPFENNSLLAFGYKNASIVVKKLGANRVSFSIERRETGKTVTTTCLVNLNQ